MPSAKAVITATSSPRTLKRMDALDVAKMSKESGKEKSEISSAGKSIVFKQKKPEDDSR